MVFRGASGRRTLGVAALVVIVALSAMVGGAEYYMSQPSFCGTSCHVMNEPYEGWKNSKHHASNNDEGEQASCVDCHYVPGGKLTIKAHLQGARHLAAYLYDPDAPLPIRAVVPDGGCLRSGCHSKESFDDDEEIQYTETTIFKHKAHFEEDALEGQTLTCDACHFKVTEEKHFEVPAAICYLCHFLPGPSDDAEPEQPQAGLVKVKLGGAAGGALNGRAGAKVYGPATLKFNEGPAKCDLCHTIPTESLQQQKSADDPDDDAITHESLTEAEVPCESCHLEVVQGNGDIEPGGVNANGCVACHNWGPDRVAVELEDVSQMHDQHVKTRRADCFDCHGVIRHDAGGDYLDNVRVACTACHENQHEYQRALLVGAPRGDDVPETPGLMHEVKTNCLGCHVESAHVKGATVRQGSGDACAGCHGEDEKDMVQDWKDTLAEEVTFVKELEKEAAALIAALQGKAASTALEEAATMLETGRRSLRIVEYGNGVHNKKYSMMLLDHALTSFEDLVDSLQASSDIET